MKNKGIPRLNTWFFYYVKPLGFFRVNQRPLGRQPHSRLPGSSQIIVPKAKTCTVVVQHLKSEKGCRTQTVGVPIIHSLGVLMLLLRGS